MAERMRQGIAQASVTSCDGRRFGMTASFGVSYVEWEAARNAPKRCSAAPTNCSTRPR